MKSALQDDAPQEVRMNTALVTSVNATLTPTPILVPVRSKFSMITLTLNVFATGDRPLWGDMTILSNQDQ